MVKRYIGLARQRFRQLWKEYLRRINARWVLTQAISVQSLPRTMLEYPLTFHGTAETITPEFPPTDVPRHLALQWIPRTIGPSYTFEIPNALLTRSEVIDPQKPNRIFTELMHDPMQVRAGRAPPISFRKRKSLARKKFSHTRERTRAFLFSNSNWDNYFHFQIDAALRYSDLCAKGVFAEPTDIILHGAPNRWQAQYLELLGLDPAGCDLLKPLDPAPLVAERLLICAPTRTRFFVSPSAIVHNRTRVLDACGVPLDAPQTRRIYISRRSAPSRHIENEDEVIALLASRDFEVVETENLSAREQVETFAYADWIVGPHGAGLTNMIFCRAPNMIELLPADRWDLGWFAAISLCMGGSYAPIVSTPRTPALQSAGLRIPEDEGPMQVDIDALRRTLDARGVH